MVEYYQGNPKYFLAVDCVIFGYEDEKLKLLLYRRGFEPVKGMWSLMGGFVQENESCEHAAIRVLNQTTGLHDIYLEQVNTFSETAREPFARVISVAYYALIPIQKSDIDLLEAHGACWWPISTLPDLIFDHGSMVRKALQRLQQMAGYSLSGSELLPEKFTLLQLRKLYEAIFQREFDPGNFRKKMLSLDLLKKTDEKNSTESRKGAYYYTIDEEAKEKETGRIVKL